MLNKSMMSFLDLGLKKFFILTKNYKKMVIFSLFYPKKFLKSKFLKKLVRRKLDTKKLDTKNSIQKKKNSIHFSLSRRACSRVWSCERSRKSKISNFLIFRAGSKRIGGNCSPYSTEQLFIRWFLILPSKFREKSPKLFCYVTIFKRLFLARFASKQVVFCSKTRRNTQKTKV